MEWLSHNLCHPAFSVIDLTKVYYLMSYCHDDNIAKEIETDKMPNDNKSLDKMLKNYLAFCLLAFCSLAFCPTNFILPQKNNVVALLTSFDVGIFRIC